MTIASNIRVPGSYNDIDASGANNRLPAYRQQLLIVAARIATPDAWAGTTSYSLGDTVLGDDDHYYICTVAGTGGASEPTWPGAGESVSDGTVTWRDLVDASEIIATETPTRVYSPDDGARYAGAGSLAHRMVRAALRQYKYAEVSVCLVDDDGSGVCATSTITFSGTAVGSGTLELRIGNDKVTYAWADGAAATAIAAGVDAAIAANHDLPVTSSVSGAVVTLRAKNAGVPGMELGRYDTSNTDYRCEVTFTTGTGVAAAVTGFASGATNPDITDALAAAESGEYPLIVTPYKDTDNLTALTAHLDSVSDEVNCNGARAWIGATATIAIATTLASSLNHERMHVAAIRKSLFTSFEVAAAAAAMHAQVGHPGKPLNTMEMTDCDAPAIEDRFLFSELNSLLWAGVTPFNADGSGAVRCVMSITTYTKNSGGSSDDTYLETTVIACLDYNRKATRTDDVSKYSQSILRDNHVDGEPSFVVTPGDINSGHIGLYKKLERYGTCQNVDDLKDQFTAVVDTSNPGRVNSDIPVEVVHGLHVLANTIRLTTTTGA